MAVRPVHVTVLDLLLRGSAHFQHLTAKLHRASRQGVVAVERRLGVAERGHAEHPPVPVLLGVAAVQRRADLHTLRQPVARLAASALEELAAHDFPGNIRELENILERATALSAGGEIGPEDLRLKPAAAEDVGARAAEGALGAPLPEYLDRVEREAILEALARTNFNRTAAAKLLGVTFRTLRYRMQRLGIKDENRH